MTVRCSTSSVNFPGNSENSCRADASARGTCNSAHEWRQVLGFLTDPFAVLMRRECGDTVYCSRADAAFAKPDIYVLVRLEERRVFYAFHG